jgi:hypothetical protein
MNSVSVLAAACAALIAASPAASAATSQDSRVGQAQVYRSLLPSDMAALLNGRGYTSVKKAEGGRFDIETADGFKFSVELAVCDVEGGPAGCLGVNAYATWSLSPQNRTKLLTAIDRFNNEYRIGKAMLLENSIYAERYVTTDRGVTLEHIGAELDEFESAMAQLGSMMHEAVGD